MDINRIFELANRCKAHSRMTKLTLYNILRLHVLIYGAESWTISASEAAFLVLVANGSYKTVEISETFSKL